MPTAGLFEGMTMSHQMPLARFTDLPSWSLLSSLVAGLGLLAGCTTTATLRTVGYDIHAQLSPAEHQLRGETTVRFARQPGGPAMAKPIEIAFALNSALAVEDVSASGARVDNHAVRALEAGSGRDTGGKAPLSVHHLTLTQVGAAPQVTLKYAGTLVQDVEAGEKPGQVHNFLMAAHIANEGIYLDAGGGWYPSVYVDAETPHGELTEYTLTVDPVADMKLVAGATFDAAESERSGKLVWRTTRPVDGMVLVGGHHAVKEQQAGPIHIALHYTPPTDPESRAMIEKNTDLFLAAAVKYLDRYQPLIGPYPDREYTIVENFFSSGFAFPGFTLLNKVLFQMGPRALGHGYLDHEMLHCWWGNSIFVDPNDGNWCEALASYAANYYGYILDDDAAGARNYRRNSCAMLSRLSPEEDLPLGQFGREGGPSRDVGYNKGALVFHMLATRIGQDNFWAAMRDLTHDYTSRYANWHVIQKLCEKRGGQKLDDFFTQWVRRGGAPALQLVAARWNEARHTLAVDLTQGVPQFDVRVPLRVKYDDGSEQDVIVELRGGVASPRVKLDRAPVSVSLDPDYQICRELPPGEMVPSSATTRADKKLLIVRPAGELSPFYQRVVDAFVGEPGSKTVVQRTPADLKDEELQSQSVLILGDAVRPPAVQALLARAGCPLKWPAKGFALDDQVYDQQGQAVLCTRQHPDTPGAGVTLYYGNSETALGRSDLLSFYKDSLLIFETSSREVEGHKVYEARPVLRRDFESPQTVQVLR